MATGLSRQDWTAQIPVQMSVNCAGNVGFEIFLLPLFRVRERKSTINDGPIRVINMWEEF